MTNLATLLHRARRFDEAEALYRRALDGYRQTVGAGTPAGLDVQGRLVDVLIDRRARRPPSPWREALEALRKSQSPGHPERVDATARLGRILAETGRSGEAEPLLRKVLAARRLAQPAVGWQVAEAESKLGACLTTLDRFDEAESLLLGSQTELASDPAAPVGAARAAAARLVQHYRARGLKGQECGVARPLARHGLSGRPVRPLSGVRFASQGAVCSDGKPAGKPH